MFRPMETEAFFLVVLVVWLCKEPRDRLDFDRCYINNKTDKKYTSLNMKCEYVNDILHNNSITFVS